MDFCEVYSVDFVVLFLGGVLQYTSTMWLLGVFLGYLRSWVMLILVYYFVNSWLLLKSRWFVCMCNKYSSINAHSLGLLIE